MPPEIHIAPAVESAVASWLADTLHSAMELRGAAHLALSGGTTPRRIYEVLAGEPYRQRIDWSRVHIYFGDERALPPTHPDSNYGMAFEALLAHVPVPSAQVHRMEADDSDRVEAAARYARVLPGKLDILLLGIGTDGHTASLFPESPALAVIDRPVVPVLGPEPFRERLSITPSVIAAAVHVGVIATGASKAPIVAAALQGHAEPRILPAALLRDRIWWLDEAAASQLERRVPG